MLDDFSLSLALKCMRSQNLEKRLCGLQEIKELVSISLRKLEYYEGAMERDTVSGGMATTPPDASWTSPEFLVSWLQREQIAQIVRILADCEDCEDSAQSS